MQNRELLAKLTQARLAQAQALRRFAHAQERLAQIEARCQAWQRSASSEDEGAEDEPTPTAPSPLQAGEAL